ncbi:MAG: hypothetical protein IJK75_02715 [Bacteroidales bacterium]|nr:hypothetical protein [Bacteroidales bacterium]
MKKRFFLFLLLAVACAISSCKGDDSLDPANTFVGAYSYEDSYQLSWGPSSGSYTDNGAFAINKVSHNKVDFSNPWKTTATVTGNQLTIDPVKESSSDGYVNYTFGTATFEAEVLTFTYQGSGSMKHVDGRSYPFSIQGSIVARRTRKE